MRSLRVLHVVPYSEQAWAYGGIPRVASALVSGLAERGHAVTVCTTDVCDGASRLRRDEPAPERRAHAARPGEIVVQVFPNLSNRLAYRYQLYLPLGLAGYLGRTAERFDVAHVHGCHHLLGAVAARKLRRAGVPWVLQPNGTAPLIERRRLAKWVFGLVAGRSVNAGAARPSGATSTPSGFPPVCSGCCPTPCARPRRRRRTCRGTGFATDWG
jgi:hypothetical protein